MQFKGAPVVVSPFWEGFLTVERQAELDRIAAAIGDRFTPDAPRALRFLAMDRVRCVILGQDPYPQKGVATGRAFEVAGVTSWQDPAVNSSLKNIVKLLHRSYKRLEVPQPIAAIRQDPDFPILPPHQLFDDWERQGVLMLNTALTCEIGRPGSHSHLWRGFTAAAIRYIDRQVPDCVWFLWGSHAAQYHPLLGDRARVFTTGHPSARNQSFVGADCFLQTWDEFAWLGRR